LIRKTADPAASKQGKEARDEAIRVKAPSLQASSCCIASAAAAAATAKELGKRKVKEGKKRKEKLREGEGKNEGGECFSSCLLFCPSFLFYLR